MNNYLEKNINALNKYVPQYAETIKNSGKKPDWFTKTKGNFNISQGAKVYPAYNTSEISKSIDELKERQLLKDDLTVFVGIGLAEILYECCKFKNKRHILVVVEPVNYLVWLALKKYNFTEWIKDGTLIFCIPDKEYLANVFGLIESRTVIESWFVLTERYILLRPDNYSEISSYTIELINQMQCNIGTVMGAGALIAENDIENLPYVIRHRGVDEIKDLYKNKPAVIVSTGPSLQKNIHLLVNSQKRVIIIAVTQALRALLAYDIIPDFVCTVDYGEVNIEHFKGLMRSNVPLIALNRSYAPILKQWAGPKFITTSGQASAPDTIVDLLSQKGSLEQGGSVSHLCLGFAYHLGCSPIAIIGQDLAYEADQSHTPLADAGGKVNIKDGVLQWDVTDPNSCLKDKPSSMGAVKLVEGYNGGTVPTNYGLASFITSFENMIRRHENKVYNCTEGGARMPGAENLTLRLFLRKHCFWPRDKLKIKPYLSLADNEAELCIKAVSIIEKEMIDLEKIIENCDKGLAADKKMLKKSSRRDSGKMKLLLKENEIYSRNAENLAKKNPLMGMHIYSISRRIYSKELNVKGENLHLLKNETDLKIRIKRNQLILEAAKEAAGKLIKKYENTKSLLAEYNKTGKDHKIVGVNDMYLGIDDAEKYLKEGNWAYPLLAAKELVNDNVMCSVAVEIVKKALNLKNEAIEKAETEYPEREKNILYHKYIRLGREVGRKEKNFKEAFKYLKKAIRIYPKRFEAKWGIATTYFHFGKNKESLGQYDKLLKENPDNIRVAYERSLVLLMIDKDAGIKSLSDVLAKTEEFDHIYEGLGDMYLEKGMKDEAKKCFKKYLKKYPTNKTVKDRLKKIA